MSYPTDLRQQPKQSQNLKQQQYMMASGKMQQALNILQAPILEISSLITNELEQNPILEYETDAENIDNQRIQDLEACEIEDPFQEKQLNFNDKELEILRQLDEEYADHFNQSECYSYIKTQDNEKLQTFRESSIKNELSLFETLMQQARETFESQNEIEMAQVIIGNLNEKGYLSTPLREISELYQFSEKDLQKILKEIQTFQPYGVGAANLKESLLIQLATIGKKKSLAYKIIFYHFEELLHNNLPLIQRKLSCSFDQIELAIKNEISKLAFSPAAQYSKELIAPILPDLTIDCENDTVVVKVNEERIPQIRANRRYLKMLNDENLPQETKDFIKQKILSARWLIKNIFQRGDTLERIGTFLAKKQEAFFTSTDGKIEPLTMREVAEALEIHESTVARAVSHKYIATPWGILPLRSFFSASYISDEGKEVSADTVRKLLKTMIEHEDKKKPLSDELLSQMLKQEGIPCARRTVAKYRSELMLGNTQQRKKF